MHDTAEDDIEDDVFAFGLLRAATLAVHVVIAAFVCLGWQMQSRVGLFLYALILPLIMMQWLFNRGSSIVSNFESLARSGHWHDPTNPYEGHLFQTLFRKVGLDLSQAQISTMLCLAMALFWMTAMFRMVMIP